MALVLFLVPGEIDDDMDWRKNRMANNRATP
jgi:hypothetical protein